MAITKASGNAVSPAAKGDLVAGSATNDAAVLGVGANGTVLTAASGQATGLEWATPSSGGMTLISTTSLTGASVTLSSIPQTYIDLRLVVLNYKPATDASQLCYRFNADATANRHKRLSAAASQNTDITYDETSINTNVGQDNTVATGITIIDFYNYASTTINKRSDYMALGDSFLTPTDFRRNESAGFYNQTTAISSLSLFPSSGNFTSGTAYLYGVK